MIHRLLGSRLRRFSTSRLDALEKLVAEQTARIQELERRLSSSQQVDFSVLHYNVLAKQYGVNCQPWFLYGADVGKEERDEMLRLFYERDPVTGEYANAGWPRWADSVLEAERIAAIEDYDDRHFRWAERRHRLAAQVEGAGADLLTLVECDDYGDFWQPTLEGLGYDSVWRKRPRDSSRDGCAIGWRSDRFELVASSGHDFADEVGCDSSRLDRTALFALLQWRGGGGGGGGGGPPTRVVVVSTHLARNPEDPSKTWARGYQYACLFGELRAFAAANGALDAPVIVTGDLNSKAVDVLAGITRALMALMPRPCHPMLWAVKDVPTPPTTSTEVRTMRIDYVLYQSQALKLLGVSDLPHLTGAIPDATHPSDHLPVLARFRHETTWAQHEECARQWLATVRGTHGARPLSAEELRMAFTYFDCDGAGGVSAEEMRRCLSDLGSQLGITLGLLWEEHHALIDEVMRTVTSTCARVAEADVGPHGEGYPWLETTTSGGSHTDADEVDEVGEVGDVDDADDITQPHHHTHHQHHRTHTHQHHGGDGETDCPWAPTGNWQMSWDEFVVVYCDRYGTGLGKRAVDLQEAFQFFDANGDGALTAEELRGVLKRLASADIAEARVAALILQMDENRDERITIDEFVRWLALQYRAYLLDPDIHWEESLEEERGGAGGDLT